MFLLLLAWRVLNIYFKKSQKTADFCVPNSLIWSIFPTHISSCWNYARSSPFFEVEEASIVNKHELGTNTVVWICSSLMIRGVLLIFSMLGYESRAFHMQSKIVYHWPTSPPLSLHFILKGLPEFFQVSNFLCSPGNLWPYNPPASAYGVTEIIACDTKYGLEIRTLVKGYALRITGMVKKKQVSQKSRLAKSLQFLLLK